MGKWLLAATPRPAASVDAPNSERLLVNSSGSLAKLAAGSPRRLRPRRALSRNNLIEIVSTAITGR